MNRLARESSPYLLQHKDNPVDWYPWGEEALARSKGEDRPILLSIGYSACHWCHVMEHESFENAEIARSMNERFVCIKVDREERPDLDQIYQGAVQAISGGGGWPLTVFLTPGLEPYFAGTYFPPADRYGRAGFPRVLDALSKAYREDRAAVATNARALTEHIRGMDRLPEAAGGPPSAAALQGTALRVSSSFDPLLGGMSGAPKFPNAPLLSFLLRQTGARGDPAPAREAALVTLERMARGGIFDQLGGGFHRYSVDETWSVPHFEKMLYDNGLLLRVYAEAILIQDLSPERRALFLRTLRMTITYLLREMRAPEGAFFATQDADSEGEEGRFFVWSPAELNRLVESGTLKPEESRAFSSHFGIGEHGNFEHGATVLFLADAIVESAPLSEACAKLLAERATRVPPATDHKILAGWNGLVVSGLAWAAQALRVAGESADVAIADRAFEAAEGAFECVSTRLRRAEGLYATLQAGVARFSASLDDYSNLIQASLDLARFSPGDPAALIARAEGWSDLLLRDFRAPEGAGFYFAPPGQADLIHRPRSLHDQATPAGTSVAVGAFLALADLLPDGTRFGVEALRQLALLAPLAERAPLGCGSLLCAALLAARKPVTIEGAQASSLCRHPHAFRKQPATTTGPIRICHAGTCAPEPAATDEALALIDRLSNGG